MATDPTLAFHWGGKALRGWAIAPSGEVLAEQSAPVSLAQGKVSGYARTFLDSTRELRASFPGAPVLLAGMAGAKGGWIEAPYAPCPVRPTDLLDFSVRAEIGGHPVRMLPGATFKDGNGNSDVMRGEEVQLIGLMDRRDLRDAVVSIPGRHCKLAVLRDGKLAQFRSFVTGELFELLTAHGLVGALATEGAFHNETFRKGVTHGAATPLASAVFAARANALQGDLAPERIRSFLSGVLIGHEAAQVAEMGSGSVLIMASGEIADIYVSAFDALGFAHDRVDAGHCMRDGMALLVREGQMVPQ